MKKAGDGGKSGPGRRKPPQGKALRRGKGGATPPSRSGKGRRVGTIAASGRRVNVRAAAARVLGEVLGEKRSLKGTIQSVQVSLAKEEDRALLKEMATGVVRRLPHLDLVIEEHTQRGLERTQLELLNLLRVGAYQILFMDRIPGYAAVHECVEAAKGLNPGAGGFVNGILRSLIEGRAEAMEAPYRFPGDEGLALRYGMPHWLARRYLSRFGTEAESLLGALQSTAPSALVFRDAPAMARGTVILRDEGFTVIPDECFPLTCTVRSGNPVRSAAFEEGLFYVMDPASQVPARILPLPNRSCVLDLCAAPGGKSVILASRLDGESWVLAVDKSRRRMRKVRDNLERLKLEGVRMARMDVEKGLALRPQWKAVLLDAPCSSLGTLKRNPEIRWQMGEEGIGKKAKKQALFLEKAAEVVAPGGVMAYSVCSIEEEETECVIDNFLMKHSNYEPAPLSLPDFLKPICDTPAVGRVFLMPHKYPWDGFFVALLRRRS